MYTLSYLHSSQIYFTFLCVLPMTDNNTKNTSDENIVKLQEFLNECIEKWWSPRSEIKTYYNENGGKEYPYFDLWKIVKINYWSMWCKSSKLSYHDLFSKDSGLMEFMNWKMMEEWYEDYKKISTRYDYRWDNERQYHAMVMWPMTAEQKLQYFLDNAVLPQ